MSGKQNSAVDEHFKLNELIAQTYKQGDYAKCEKYCIEDIKLYPRFVEEYRENLRMQESKWQKFNEEHGLRGSAAYRELNERYTETISNEIDIRIPSFETLAKIYEKQKRYDEGIQVCEAAIKYGLKDGTKGGFKGRQQKFMKLIETPPSARLNLEPGRQNNNALVVQTAEIVKTEFPELGWHISVSFNKSTSDNFSKALFLAKNTSYRYFETEYEGKTIHQAIFTREREQYIAFIQLYELVCGWKSSFAMINGMLMDRKIIGGLNYCYGDKCRSGRSDFCFGASDMTENPFGCHRLQISKYNNPWWSFSYQQGNRIVIDKKAIKQRIDEYCRAYIQCPSFNYEDVIKQLNALPEYLSISQFNKLREGKNVLATHASVQLGNTQRSLLLQAENSTKSIGAKIIGILTGQKQK